MMEGTLRVAIVHFRGTSTLQNEIEHRSARDREGEQIFSVQIEFGNRQSFDYFVAWYREQPVDFHVRHAQNVRGRYGEFFFCGLWWILSMHGDQSIGRTTQRFFF